MFGFLGKVLEQNEKKIENKWVGIIAKYENINSCYVKYKIDIYDKSLWCLWFYV